MVSWQHRKTVCWKDKSYSSSSKHKIFIFGVSFTLKIHCIWEIRFKCESQLPAHPHLCFSFFRSAYCAASVASLTNILTPKLFEGTTNWILRYKTPPKSPALNQLHSSIELFYFIFNAFFFWPQLSELGGWPQWSARAGGPWWLHFLRHRRPRHPGQGTHAGSQSAAGEEL